MLGGAVCALLAGCSSSSASHAEGSYIGRASNIVLFVQWTRAGGSVSGSIRAARAEPYGRVVVSNGKPLTGTLAGKGLSVHLGDEVVVGELDGRGFWLSLPGKGGSTTSASFVPGTRAEFQQRVRSLKDGE